MDDDYGQRLFIVCGRSVEDDVLKTAFRPFGNVQNVKVIREKGVAYVKFDRASSAALAMETLNGAVLNNGRGPKLKVLLAEAPTVRGMPPPKQLPDEQLSSDPDNMPPRSRLFIVVPKTAEARVIQDEMSAYEDLEYCKTDLISAKGVVFCKYSRASSALRVMEEVSSKGMLGPYKVKCMLAEPKTKRNRLDAGPPGLFPHTGKLDYMSPMAMEQAATAAGYRLGSSTPFPGFNFADARGNPNSGLTVQQAAALGMQADYSALQGLAGGMNFNAALQAASQQGSVDGLGQQMSLGGFGSISSLAVSTPEGVPPPMNAMGGFHSSSGNNSSMGSGGSMLSTGTFNPMGTSSYMGAMSPGPGPQQMQHAAAAAAAAQHHAAAMAAVAGAASPVPLSKQRLFVVVHKSVGDDVLSRLFRAYAGMEYCDLKKDKATGKSKGYCYVNYSTPEAAAAAVAELNGIEFPPGSGYRLKVMYAEIMGSAGGSATQQTMLGRLGVGRPPRSPAVVSGVSSSGPSPVHTPLNRNVSQEIAAVQEGLSAISLAPQLAGAGEHGSGGQMGGQLGAQMGGQMGAQMGQMAAQMGGQMGGQLGGQMGGMGVNGDGGARGLHDLNGAPLPSPVTATVARELMFNVA